MYITNQTAIILKIIIKILCDKILFQVLPIILVTIFSNSAVFAQFQNKGIPIMKYYSVSDYNAGRQSWQIIQDNNGILYFANNSGLLQYDGNYWNLFKVNNNSIVRSTAIDNKNIIYMFALMASIVIKVIH